MAVLTCISRRSSGTPRGLRWIGRRVFLCVLLAAAAISWVAGTSVANAEEPVASEYQIKAAFLINFPKYVEWPSSAFAQTNSPIVIEVQGETKVAEEIQKIITGRTVNGREIVLKYLPSGGEPGGCHLLFISAAEQKRSPSLLLKLKDPNILTVGESDSFLASGGIINLARRDQKIALEVNLAAADRTQIKISSKLLRIASVVKGKSP
jgi:hypothetical protein